LARYIGQYEIVNELGAGQYGTVYLAAGEVPARGRRPPRRRIVAIKKLRNTADDESVAQLTREFSLLDQVKHRGIVRVFDYVEQEHSVVMEYIHGSTLRNILDKLQSAREQVFTEAAVEIGCEIADALYQAYTTPGDNGEPLQLVHRDLKPDNIMLTRQGEVKVLDWGLARVDNTDFRGSNPDRIKGTLLYMAPEQARGDAVDHRSDVFSLGLILFEMLMREPLYQVNERAGDPLSEVMRAIETGDTAARCAQLETRLPQVGPVLTRALRPRPAERYPTAQDMMVDLRRTLYRERGADLKEFCEFYFGQISDIGPAPKLEDIGAGMTKPKSERLSIEERLRRSMARDKGASPLADGPSAGNPVTGGAPVRPPVGGGASRATPFTPSSRGPRAPRAPSAPRAPVATPRAPAAPPRAPQVSRAPAAPPRAPQATRPPMGAAPPPPPKARKPMTPVGSRSPDETGMLKMVPLNDDEDEVEVQGDPSATMFFAIPAPKAERSRPAPPPTPGAGGPPPPPGVGGPPPPPRPGGFAAGPPQPPMQRAPLGGGPGALGAPPPPAAIRGPVAGAGGPPAGGATPFQTAGNLPPPGDNQQRTNSHRAYALVTAAIMVVCVGLGAAFLFVTMNKDDEKVASATPTEVAPEPSKKAKKKRKKAASDTGEPEEEKPKKKSSRRTARRSPSSTPAAPKAKPKPTGPAPLTVVLKTPDQATKVEVQCPGVRQRANFSGGRAVLQGVPQSGCKLFFKGAGAMAVYEGSKVAGGRTLSCSLASGAARCN
jgi:serine/threonine-protein kinase